MPEIDCDKIVALLVLIGGEYEGTSSTTYGENVAYEYRGAKFETKTKDNYTIRFSSYCNESNPKVGEIMGVKLSSVYEFTTSESGTYPNKPEWDYKNERGTGTVRGEEEFLLLNTRERDDFWLVGVDPPSEVTPLATTSANRGTFLAWIGSRKAINQWISLNRQLIDVETEFTNFAGGISSSKVYQYSGWRMACSFPYEALLKYPFCGGLVKGQEDKGNQYINLCQNDLGVCKPDCCDCCAIGEKFLQVFKI